MAEYDLLTDPAIDVYFTETPLGFAKAIFKADDEDGSGVRFDELDFIVGDWIRDWISEHTGPGGIGLDPDTIIGETYYRFCQPKGSGVTIQRPWYLEPTAEEQAQIDADEASLDDASGQRADMISALRNEIRNASGAVAKLAAARRLLAQVSAGEAIQDSSALLQSVIAGLDEANETGRLPLFDSASPVNLGPVFTEYRNDPEGAIKRLLHERTGDARAVWERQGLGTIDLIYGNANTGLAKIARKHPEMIGKLPRLLRKGKLVRKPGANKVFLVLDGNPPEVAVIALDWYGAEKTWVVTSYEDVQGGFTGGLKTMNTEALDSAWVDILYAGQ